MLSPLPKSAERLFEPRGQSVDVRKVTGSCQAVTVTEGHCSLQKD
jgi:hypothetical protein